jgi:hypothetical protein
VSDRSSWSKAALLVKTFRVKRDPVVFCTLSRPSRASVFRIDSVAVFTTATSVTVTCIDFEALF